jgi:hypothetical protein
VITVLVVSAPDPEVEALEGRHPSVEVLFSRDVEETLEKLGRNRRIDAVLLLGLEPEPTAREILEDNPAAPPLYAPLDRPIPGIRMLTRTSPSELLDRIAADLAGA